MATVYRAQINPSDYEMIRGILNNDLPDAYEEWLKFLVKGESDFTRQGHTVGHIKIDPDELARYCGMHGGHRSRHGLSHFVIKKSEGEKLLTRTVRAWGCARRHADDDAVLARQIDLAQRST